VNVTLVGKQNDTVAEPLGSASLELDEDNVAPSATAIGIMAVPGSNEPDAIAIV
jgi:hypothetical protein